MAEDDFIDVEGIEYDPYNPLDVQRVELTEQTLIAAKEKNVRASLERRQQAYQRVFTSLSEDAQIVYADLCHFTFADDTVFHENERIHCLLTGRKEVSQRIEDHVRLSLDDLVTKYTQPRK